MARNKNYISGRRFEYKYAKDLRELGCIVMRTAGSHGPFDLIAIGGSGQVTMIQCKVTEEQSVAERMLKDFRAKPPFPPALAEFTQMLVVKVKHSQTISTSV